MVRNARRVFQEPEDIELSSDVQRHLPGDSICPGSLGLQLPCQHEGNYAITFHPDGEALRLQGWTPQPQRNQRDQCFPALLPFAGTLLVPESHEVSAMEWIPEELRHAAILCQGGAQAPA